MHATMAKAFLDPADIRNDPAAGGGSLRDMGPYVISACNAILDGPPTRVVAAAEIHPEFGVDGLTSALLDYGGRHASITVSVHSGPTGWGSHQQLSILGSTGWLRMSFPFAHGRPVACRIDVGDATSVGDHPSSSYAFEPANHYLLQAERFSRFVLGEGGTELAAGERPRHRVHHRGRLRVGPQRQLVLATENPELSSTMRVGRDSATRRAKSLSGS